MRTPKALKQLRKEFRTLEQESLSDPELLALPEDQRLRELEERRSEIAWADAKLDWAESRYLMQVAERWGIEPPSKAEWYGEPKDEILDRLLQDPRTKHNPAILNKLGRAMITKQITDARRAAVKWWVEVLTPVLALAVALLALFKDIIVEVLKTLQ